MESSGNDDENDLSFNIPITVHVNVSNESRPCTPPMDHSLKAHKSLGVMMSPQSPPYQKIRSMKIAGSPRLFSSCKEQLLTSTPTPNALNNRHRRSRNHLSVSSVLDFKDKIKEVSSNSADILLNPFVHSNRSKDESRQSSLSSSKHLDSDSTPFSGDLIQNEISPIHEIKRPKLCMFNTSRFEKEFCVEDILGSGQYGCVYKCINLLNGCLYAIKKSLKPVNNERTASNEIYAHGALEHPNIVRNYSSWIEDGHVFIQNEYCHGGSLEESIVKNGPMEEKELLVVLEHISQALRFMHTLKLAHMDVKPGNIFITSGPRLFWGNSDYSFDSEEEENEVLSYKLGDLGHVTMLGDSADVVEGDCRYLPKEILDDDYSNLTKVDIFAFGLSLFEAAGGGPLPKNGEDWHSIRNGSLKRLPRLSFEFHDLLTKMIQINSEKRPSAQEILQSHLIGSLNKSGKERHEEPKAERQKIQFLEQQLNEAVKCVNLLRKGQDKRLACNVSILAEAAPRLAKKLKKSNISF